MMYDCRIWWSDIFFLLFIAGSTCFLLEIFKMKLCVLMLDTPMMNASVVPTYKLIMQVVPRKFSILSRVRWVYVGVSVRAIYQICAHKDDLLRNIVVTFSVSYVLFAAWEFQEKALKYVQARVRR